MRVRNLIVTFVSSRRLPVAEFVGILVMMR